jgi:hypothetical protein
MVIVPEAFHPSTCDICFLHISVITSKKLAASFLKVEEERKESYRYREGKRRKGSSGFGAASEPMGDGEP